MEKHDNIKKVEDILDEFKSTNVEMPNENLQNIIEKSKKNNQLVIRNYINLSNIAETQSEQKKGMFILPKLIWYDKL